MIQADDLVVVGVSGGADSVCLLSILNDMKKELSLELVVVHVNHGIRKTAYKDALFVEEICKNYQIPYFLVEDDIRKIAREEKLSEEEAGRNLRYESFYKILDQYEKEKHKKVKIAVAHNQNDRAETLLFNLLRGSKIKGIAGIVPVRDVIIRPMLGVSRDEIEAYLEENNILYCQDETNDSDQYTRNKIRHHIIPYVEKEICTASVAHLNEFAELMEMTEEYLMQQTMVAYYKIVKEENNSFLIREESYACESQLIQSYLVHLVICKLAGSKKDITSVHVKAVMELYDRQTGKNVSLPYGIIARKTYEGIILEQKRDESLPIEARKLSVPCSLYVEGLGKVNLAVFPRENMGEIQEKTYTKWFDYDKIDESLMLRMRETGDFLAVNSQNGTKSLKEYLINEKIPKENRDSIFLLADGKHILWVIGHRISEKYKITSETVRVLEVTIENQGG
ncbi:MAG: tRNA lysidine(34) synthetase TilS [Clostridiales bacterium]|nr:tRNA lysidine(34) synthetase TilS [Clostridiales bacterium]